MARCLKSVQRILPVWPSLRGGEVSSWGFPCPLPVNWWGGRMPYQFPLAFRMNPFYVFSRAGLTRTSILSGSEEQRALTHILKSNS